MRPLLLLLALVVSASPRVPLAQPLLEAEPLYSTPGLGRLLFAYGRLMGEDAFGIVVFDLNDLSTSNPVIRYFSEGADGEWTDHVVPFYRLQVKSVTAADWDLDGRDDLLVTTHNVYGGGIVFYRNVGGPGEVAFTEGELLVGGSGFRDEFLLSDLNGDGYPDLVYRYDAAGLGAGDHIGVALNNRGRSAVRQNRGDYYNLHLASDINGDDRTDIVVRTSGVGAPEPRVYVFEVDGGGDIVATHQPAWESVGGTPLGLGHFDADGDGHEEIITVTESGDNLALHSVSMDAGFGLTRAWTVPLDTVAYREGYEYRVQPADLLGDGGRGLVLSLRSEGFAFRYFFVWEGDELQGLGVGHSNLWANLPFFRSPSGSYARLTWSTPSFNVKDSFVERRVAPTSVPPPDPPSGLAAQTGGRGEASLTWVPLPPGSTSHVYHVELVRADGAYRYGSEAAAQGTSSLRFFHDADFNGTAEPRRAFRNLPAGTYEVRVRAVDGSGQRSDPSAPVTFVVDEGPLPHTPLDLAADSTGGGIALTYRLRGLADSVLVYRSEGGGDLERVATLDPSLTQYVDRRVEGGATYTYRLASALDGEASELSEPATATAPDFIVVALPLPDPDYAVERAVPYDLDGDGREDVVVSARHVATSERRVFFVPATPAGLDVAATRRLGEAGGTGWGGIHVADWDRDVGPDLIGEQAVCSGGVCTDNQVRVWTLVPGTLDVGREYTFALPSGGLGDLQIIDVGDLDLDGRADLLLAPASYSEAFVGWSEPGFDMAFDRFLNHGMNSWQVTLIDHDQDGLQDIIVPVLPDGAPTVFRNNGDRTFTETPVGMPGSTGYRSFEPLWFDDDEYPDLLVGSEDAGGPLTYAIHVFDEATGTYSPHPIGPFGDRRGGPRAAHLNDDGYVDFVEVVVPSQGPSRLVLWMNEANASLTPTERTLPSGAGLACLMNLDADGDGARDVVYCQGGRAELYVVPMVGTVVPPPAVPSSIAVVGDTTAVEVTWDAAPSAWARPGHVSYGLVLSSEADTLVVGEVTLGAGTPRAAADPRRPHGGQIVLRDLPPASYALQIAAIDPMGQTSGLSAPVTFNLTPVGVEQAPPLADALAPVYPNPSRGSITFSLSAGRSHERAEVAVYDVLGRRVAVLHDGPLHAGLRYELGLNARALAAGAYVVRASGDELSLTRRFTVVR